MNLQTNQFIIGIHTCFFAHFNYLTWIGFCVFFLVLFTRLFCESRIAKLKENTHRMYRLIYFDIVECDVRNRAQFTFMFIDSTAKHLWAFSFNEFLLLYAIHTTVFACLLLLLYLFVVVRSTSEIAFIFFFILSLSHLLSHSQLTNTEHLSRSCHCLDLNC